MLELTKGDQVKMLDKESSLIEALKRDGWKAKNVKEVLEEADPLLDDDMPNKKSKKKI